MRAVLPLVLTLMLSACGAKALPTTAIPTVPSVQPIHFGAGSRSISAADAPTLEVVLQLMRADPSLHLMVAGYTDSEGNDASNLELSRARAAFVQSFLASAGIEATRVTVEGRGEGGTTGDANQDRRVDFAFTRGGPAPVPAAVADAGAQT